MITEVKHVVDGKTKECENVCAYIYIYIYIDIYIYIYLHYICVIYYIFNNRQQKGVLLLVYNSQR